MKKLALIVLFLCISYAMSSQEPVSIHLTSKDGLPDIEFYDMLEDKEGFIWLAADKGLFRYNGKEYKNYSNPKKRGLSVFNLKLDTKGRLWSNNISGQFFYVENDSLKLFIDVKGKIKYRNLPVFSLDKKDNLYIATDQGLYFIYKDTKKVQLLVDKQGVTEMSSHEIKYHNDNLYFVHDSLYIFKQEVLIKKVPLNVKDNYQRIFRFNNQNYYISSLNKWYNSKLDNNTRFGIINETSNEIEHASIPEELINKTILQITEIENRVWVSTNKGVYIYKNDTGNFEFEMSFLNDSYTTKVIKDNNNNYWITTLRDGIYIIPNLNITKLKTPEEIKNVTTIKVIENQIIYGTDNGYLIKKKIKKRESEIVKFEDKLRIFVSTYNAKTKLIFIVGDTNAFIWNLENDEIISAGSIRGSKDLSVFGNNILLESFHNGANLIDFSNYEKELRKLKEPNAASFIQPKKIEKISQTRSYVNHYSSDSTIYIGAIDKFTFLDKNGKELEVTDQGNSILATDITETSDGTIWVATNEQGVIGIKDKNVIYHYNKSNGLNTNETLKIEADGNDLWIVSNKSLHFLNRKKEAFKSFSFQHEIPLQKVEDISVSNDAIYLAGDNGVFIIDKNYFNKDAKSPEVYFESILIGNIEEKRQSNYRLPYNESSFEVNFNTNVFNSKESIIYLYRLKGLEKAWAKTKTGNVRYPSLPPGNYTFEVKALSNKGVESKGIQSLEIEVTKPVWYQWWFYLILLILLFTYYRIALIRIRKKQKVVLENEKISKELVFSQLENLRSQMNPHFIFNVLNSIQEYIITNDKYTASLYLAEFSKLIRLYLDHSRQETIRLSEELKALRIYLDLEKNRFEDDFNYTITIDENVNTETTEIPSLFIQPYVENSIKHGLLHKSNHKVLSIDFKYNDLDNTLICNIIDNGIGREESRKINKRKEEYHIPFATEANSNRVNLLNKNRRRKIRIKTIDLFNDNLEPKGTRITIHIPL